MSIFGFSSNKKEKRFKIQGQYFSSHPDLHKYKNLRIEFGDSGVYVYHKKQELKHYTWNDIVNFYVHIEDRTHIQSSQRATIPRVAVLGLFALAVPKQETTGALDIIVYYTLTTCDGKIELKSPIKSMAGKGSVAETTRNVATIELNRTEKLVDNVKRMVAENISIHEANESINTAIRRKTNRRIC